MVLDFREIPVCEENLPSSYVLIGLYGGTSNFPMTTFFVLRPWWDLFKADPEIKIHSDQFEPEQIAGGT